MTATDSPNTAWSPYPVGRVTASPPPPPARLVSPSNLPMRERQAAKPFSFDKNHPQYRRYAEWGALCRPAHKPRPDLSLERAFNFWWFCSRGDHFGSWPLYAGGVARIGPYCGAPEGVRCGCGAQLAGHDAGDEDDGATRATRRIQTTLGAIR